MKRFSTYLSDELYEQLRWIAFQRRRKLNDIVCEALKSYLEQAREEDESRGI